MGLLVVRLDLSAHAMGSGHFHLSVAPPDAALAAAPNTAARAAARTAISSREY